MNEKANTVQDNAPLARRFTFKNYLGDHAGAISASLACLLALYLMLRVLALEPQAALCACLLVAFLLAGLLTWSFLRKRSFYRELEETIPSLEHAYYLDSLLETPSFLEGKLLQDACHAVCLADADDLNKVLRATEDNQRFVELWTHELKTPIAAAKLTLAHLHGQEAQTLRQDIERIEAATEKALFNSRSVSLSADYRLCETPLLPLCRESAKQLANLLIGSGITLRFDVPEKAAVITDAAWTRFVISQILSNCAKYGARCIRFKVETPDGHNPAGKHASILHIIDDGFGIAADEVPHVFERGFSGSNGRAEGSSTGFGLYLAAQICNKMGLGLSLDSEEGCGTRVSLVFPLYRQRLQDEIPNLTES